MQRARLNVDKQGGGRPQAATAAAAAVVVAQQLGQTQNILVACRTTLSRLGIRVQACRVADVLRSQGAWRVCVLTRRRGGSRVYDLRVHGVCVLTRRRGGSRVYDDNHSAVASRQHSQTLGAAVAGHSSTGSKRQQVKKGAAVASHTYTGSSSRPHSYQAAVAGHTHTGSSRRPHSYGQQ